MRGGRGAKRGGAAHPAEEDHARAGATEGLVGGGGHHVTVLEGLVRLLSRHQATAHPTWHYLRAARRLLVEAVRLPTAEQRRSA